MGVANSVCCSDFKVSVNQALITISYPLPIPDDLFATVAGGRVFSKLDLSNAYQQLKLTTESQKYLTINTHTQVCSHIDVSRMALRRCRPSSRRSWIKYCKGWTM